MHKIKVPTVTLTSDLATWSLLSTHYLVMIIVSAKYFLNPTMYDEVMGGTRY